MVEVLLYVWWVDVLGSHKMWKELSVMRAGRGRAE